MTVNPVPTQYLKRYAIMKNKTVYFKVGIKRPEGLMDADLREYIKDAVANWNKGGDPMSPLWGIDHCTVSKLCVRNKK